MSELVSLLDDDVFAVRRAAARALGAVGDPGTVSALAAVSGATVVESLVALLSDEDSGVVVSAQAALAAVGRPAVEPLAAFGDRRRPPACRVCGCALGNRDGGVRYLAPSAAIETVACS